MTDTTVLAALLVGLVSFVSPCVLPLVPGYLSAISGVSLADIEEGKVATKDVLIPALIFCASFTVVFVLLGLTATGIGQLLGDNRLLIDKVAGVIIILLGIFFILTPFINRLNREWRPEFLVRRMSKAGPVVTGVAFAVAWTPCIGPTLGAILTAAAAADTAQDGAILLFFYATGLAIPFIVTALLFNKAMVAFRFLRDRWVWIVFVSGIILIIMGVMMFTNQLTYLNIEAQKLLNTLGLDFLYRL